MLTRFLILTLIIGASQIFFGCKPKAEQRPDPQMSRNMLKLRGYQVTTEDFFRAIKTEESLVINGFLDAGIDPNSKNKHGITALNYAIQNTNPKTVRIIARRANINLKDDFGDAPLHLAIRTSNTEAIKTLMDAKADVNVTGRHGEVTNQSPLYAALLVPNIPLFKKLLELGADPNIADSAGAFPLSEACIQRGAEVATIKLLIEHKADVNKREENGATSLIYAAQNSGIDAETRKSIVKLLLDSGADKTLKDKSGKDALAWAKEAEHAESIELLQ